jgi:hypothetical protein
MRFLPPWSIREQRARIIDDWLQTESPYLELNARRLTILRVENLV